MADLDLDGALHRIAADSDSSDDNSLDLDGALHNSAHGGAYLGPSRSDNRESTPITPVQNSGRAPGSNYTVVTHPNPNASPLPQKLELDGALHRIATDMPKTVVIKQDADTYAWQLLRKGYSPEQVAQKVANKYGTQVSVEDVQFNESPMYAIYKAMQKPKQIQKSIEEQNVRLNAPPPNTLIGEDSTVNADVQRLAMSDLNREMEEPDPISNYLHQISKEIKVKTTPLEKVYAKGNPASAYVAAAGLAVAGAAAGVLDLPYDIAKGGAEAVEHPVRAAESFALAPVTVVKEAAEDAASGKMFDYGKVVGQTLVGGEVADELGLSPSKVWEKLPDRITSPAESVAEKVLTPAREFAERVHSKLNDVVRYKPVITTVIVETPEGPKISAISDDPRSAGFATIKDFGKIRSIKPVTAAVAETSFILRTRPFEDFTILREAPEEGESVGVESGEIKKIRTETAEGIAATKSRLRLGYEIETEKPVSSSRVVVEYANRLGRKATIASEISEDAVKLVLRKGDYVKGYGIKTIESVPVQLNQEDFGVPRLLGEAKEAMPEEPPTFDLRDLDEVAKKELDLDVETSKEVKTRSKPSTSESPREKSPGEKGQILELESKGSKMIAFDLSEEFKELERSLTENKFEVPDVVEELFDAGKELGKNLLDKSAALPFEGVWDLGKLWSSGVPGIGATTRDITSDVNQALSGEKPKNSSKDRNRNPLGLILPIPDSDEQKKFKQYPYPSPITGEKPDSSLFPFQFPDSSPDVTLKSTPKTTPAVTPIVDTTPIETKKPPKTKKKHTKPNLPPLSIYLSGGDDFWSPFEQNSRRTRRGVKVNPVVKDPLKILWG